MTPPRACAALVCLALAACSGPAGDDDVATRTTLLEGPAATVPAPTGDRTVIYGGEDDPRLTFSAGFMKRVDLGEIRPVSELSWAPNARSFYVNDSGSAAWSELRLWQVGGRQVAQESASVREAAIAELARLNDCARPARQEYATRGLGWGRQGDSVYVLTEVRRVQACSPDIREDRVVSLVEVATGRVLQTRPVDEALRAWPGLSGATLRPDPVTGP